MRVHTDAIARAGPPTRLTRQSKSLAALNNVWKSVASHRGSHHRLMVSPFVFGCCWWFIVAMHFFNGTLALVFSMLYLFFSLPSVYPTVAVVEVSLRLMKISGYAYMGIAAVHWLALIRIIRRSIQHRGLTFSSCYNPILPDQPSAGCLSALSVKWKALHRRFWKPWNHLFGVEGIFGVNGKYFYVAFLAREIIEVGLQTYQAFQLSGSVRRAWVTNLAVATIILNSVSTPVVYMILRRHQESARRFMSILVDMSLDFCCAAIIPMCVVFPYIAAYDITIGSMPVTLTYDDVRFASSLIEIRQFCVTSALDFFATMLPQTTVFMCLNLAQKIVRREKMATNNGNVVRPNRFSMTIAVSSDPAAVSSSDNVQPTTTKTAHTTILKRIHSVFHVMMIVWSAIVVIVHVRAVSHARRSVPEGCRQSLSAWYAVGSPCSVMQINCHRFRIGGSTADISDVLNPLDRGVLRKLIITHCPLLAIPPMLGEFSAMTDLDIYNSTLMSWPIEAAATSSKMKSLVNFNWLRSPFVTFPAGLLHNDLPKGFSRFTLAKSNVTELPAQLGTLWTRATLDVFSLQFTQIRFLPPSFSQLNIRKLRLSSNRIQAIRSDALATKRLTALHLSGNPLESLPDAIGDTNGLLEVLVEHTNVRMASAGVERWWNQPSTGLLSRHLLSMFGSPICDGSSMPYCSRDHGNINGTIRWGLVDPQRGLDK